MFSFSALLSTLIFHVIMLFTLNICSQGCSNVRKEVLHLKSCCEEMQTNSTRPLRDSERSCDDGNLISIYLGCVFVSHTDASAIQTMNAQLRLRKTGMSSVVKNSNSRLFSERSRNKLCLCSLPSKMLTQRVKVMLSARQSTIRSNIQQRFCQRFPTNICRGETVEETCVT